MLKDNKIKVNEDQYLLTSLTKACHLKNDRVKTRLPIQKSLLVSLLQQLAKLFDTQPYLKTLYQMLFSMAYFGLLRVSELMISNHNIKAQDVQIVTNKKKIQLILRSSKTHGKNVRPQKVKIQSLSLKHDTKKEISRNFCPYRLLRKYISLRGAYHNQNEPFFVFADGMGVSAA